MRYIACLRIAAYLFQNNCQSHIFGDFRSSPFSTLKCRCNIVSVPQDSIDLIPVGSLQRNFGFAFAWDMIAERTQTRKAAARQDSNLREGRLKKHFISRINISGRAAGCSTPFGYSLVIAGVFLWIQRILIDTAGEVYYNKNSKTVKIFCYQA